MEWCKNTGQIPVCWITKLFQRNNLWVTWNANTPSFCRNDSCNYSMMRSYGTLKSNLNTSSTIEMFRWNISMTMCVTACSWIIKLKLITVSLRHEPGQWLVKFWEKWSNGIAQEITLIVNIFSTYISTSYKYCNHFPIQSSHIACGFYICISLLPCQ